MWEVRKEGKIVLVLDMNSLVKDSIEAVRDYVAEHLCMPDLRHECLNKTHYVLYLDSSDGEYTVHYKGKIK